MSMAEGMPIKPEDPPASARRSSSSRMDRSSSSSRTSLGSMMQVGLRVGTGAALCSMVHCITGFYAAVFIALHQPGQHDAGGIAGCIVQHCALHSRYFCGCVFGPTPDVDTFLCKSCLLQVRNQLPFCAAPSFSSLGRYQHV